MLGPYTALALLGSLLIVHALRPRPHRAAIPESELAPERTRRALVLAATLAAHSIVLPVIGFIPASTILFVIAAWLFGSARWHQNLAIGLVAAVVLFVIFTSGLGLSLPIDPVTRWYGG
jgi:putative tricarboxylic transport membrane protein